MYFRVFVCGGFFTSKLMGEWTMDWPSMKSEMALDISPTTCTFWSLAKATEALARRKSPVRTESCSLLSVAIKIQSIQKS